MVRYLTALGMAIMVALTLSLVLLPMVMPQLPSPLLVILFVPIVIIGLLLYFAFAYPDVPYVQVNSNDDP